MTATELLDAMERRFRAKVTLEGAVAEVHLGKQIRALCASGALQRYQEHDRDGYPDYTVWVPGRAAAQLIECKNVRDAREAYRQGGREVAYKVETQKTRITFISWQSALARKPVDGPISCSSDHAIFKGIRSTLRSSLSCTEFLFLMTLYVRHGILPSNH